MRSGNGHAAPDGDLRDIRRRLADAPGKDKLDLLLEAPDPVALVRALPEQELYQAILEIGVADAAELLSLASPAQFAHFLDRSAWPRPDEGPSSREVLRWLTLARTNATSDQALARYREQLANLDLELLELVLHEQLRIHEIEEGVEPPVVDWGRVWRTPDNHFLVEFVVGGAEYETMKLLLEDLFVRNQLEGTRLLESIRWELPTELAEVARRWREGRLRDLGFPTLEEALSFYARPAKRTQPAAMAASAESSALVATPAQGPLLERALALVSPDQLGRVDEGLVYAANAALVAGAVAADDAHGARSALRDARATLSLGLELLSGGDPAAAAALLEQRPVREIFQAGMGELYALQSRARAVGASARLPGAKTATILEPPYSELVDALSRKRPALADPRSRGRTRAPASRAEVHAAAALLEEAAAIIQVLEARGIGPAALGPLAEAAGLAPTAVRASFALRARARADLLGKPGVSFSDPDSGTPSQDEIGPSAEAIGHKVDELLSTAAKLVGGAATPRALEALRRTSR